MEIKAKQSNIRISPRKLRLVADLVRGKDVDLALEQLSLLNKKGAMIVSRTVKSASANAMHNHRLLRKDLVISKILVNGAKHLKRWRPVSRGMAHTILKRQAHLEVFLTAKPDAKPVEAKKVEKAKTASTAKTKQAVDSTKIKKVEAKSAVKADIVDVRRKGKSKEQKSTDKVRGKTDSGSKKNLFRRKSI